MPARGKYFILCDIFSDIFFSIFFWPLPVAGHPAATRRQSIPLLCICQFQWRRTRECPSDFPHVGVQDSSHCLCPPAAVCLKCTTLRFLPCVAASFQKSCWNFVCERCLSNSAEIRVQKFWKKVQTTSFFSRFCRCFCVLILIPPFYNTAKEIKGYKRLY